jgi:hypothetical protein
MKSLDGSIILLYHKSSPETKILFFHELPKPNLLAARPCCFWWMGIAGFALSSRNLRMKIALELPCSVITLKTAYWMVQ